MLLREVEYARPTTVQDAVRLLAGHDGARALAGGRAVPAEDFFLGVYMTAAGPGELLTKITVPPGKSDGFASVAIGKDGTCIVNAAASVNGTARIALGCVAAVPVLLQPDSAED